jgi:nucleotide-binding universal stress UspA family protein
LGEEKANTLEARSPSMFDVVVVGADNSVTARRAVEAASGIAKMSGGTLHIVSAFRLKMFAGKSLPEDFALNNEGDVEGLLQELSFIPKAQGIDPVLHRVTGDPAESLVKIAEELHADLLVVGNHGMKGVKRMLGSVPNSVAHNANCSVAIIDTTE